MPATIVGEAAAVSGLIGFSIARAQDSLVLMKALSAARNFGSDADVLRNRLLLARVSLEDWIEDVERAGKDQESPFRSLDWTIIKDSLMQLEKLLTDADGLEKKYHLTIINEQPSEMGKENPDVSKSGTYFARTLRKLRPESKSVTAQKLQDETSAWTKTKYGLTGKSELRQLVFDIESHVEAVKRWTTAKETRFRLRETRQLLTEILARATTIDEVKDVNVVLAEEASDQNRPNDYSTQATLGRLKAFRMELGLDVSPTELRGNVQPASSNTKIPVRLRLKAGHMDSMTSIGTNRETAVYQDIPVLLEYKKMPENIKNKLKHRITALGILLSKADGQLFANLPFLGLYEDIGSDRYAFVFRLPQVDIENRMSKQVVSLLDCFSDKASSKPSLDSRFRIALQISTALRNFHTTGWLHKCLLPENILFTPTNSATVDHTSITQGPFLAGFGFARAANPTEFSEIPLTSPNTDIYCHPAIIGPRPKPFCKAFDLYSLGIILLEVMFWKQFTRIIDDATAPVHTGPSTTNAMAFVPIRAMFLQAKGEGSIFHSLAQICPEAYCDTIRICIQDRTEEEWEEMDTSVCDQNLVVQKLSRLS